MRVLVAIFLFGFGLSACGQSTKTGAASASGDCAVSHSGNYDTITIKNCGIGARQGDKIVDLLNKVLAHQERLDELLKIASQSRQTTIIQGSVDQSNSGGCNQQVVGGNGNVNNCEPPPPHVTYTEQEVPALVPVSESAKTLLVAITTDRNITGAAFVITFSGPVNPVANTNTDEDPFIQNSNWQAFNAYRMRDSQNHLTDNVLGFKITGPSVFLHGMRLTFRVRSLAPVHVVDVQLVDDINGYPGI